MRPGGTTGVGALRAYGKPAGGEQAKGRWGNCSYPHKLNQQLADWLTQGGGRLLVSHLVISEGLGEAHTRRQYMYSVLGQLYSTSV
jgi:hypothetical protein